MVSLKNQLLHNQYFVFLLVYTCKKKAWKKILTEGQKCIGGRGVTGSGSRTGAHDRRAPTVRRGYSVVTNSDTSEREWQKLTPAGIFRIGIRASCPEMTRGTPGMP